MYFVYIYILSLVFILNCTLFGPRAVLLLYVYVMLLTMEFWSVVAVLQHLMAKIIEVLLTNASLWLHRMVWSQFAKIQFPRDNLSLCLQHVGATQGSPFSEGNVLGKYLSFSNFTNRKKNKTKKNPKNCVLHFQKDFLLCRFFASPLILPSQNSNSMA